MKLKNIIDEEDDFINEECYFIKSYNVDILNNKGKKIGRAFGYLVDTQKVAADIIENEGSNFFIELDGISQLLCEYADYIIRKIPLKKIQSTHNILCLNWINLDSEYLCDKNEMEALELLFENAEMIVYSLDMNNFDDTYLRLYEKLLKHNEWKYYKEYGFYIKSHQDMWTKDKIKERLYRPFTKVTLNEKEFPFWEWLFTDITEIERGYIIDLSDMIDESDLTLRIFQYDFAKNYLDIINKWATEPEYVSIEISPIALSLFLEYIDDMKSMREEDNCVTIEFVNTEVENTIDTIINKYHKKFHKLKKDTYIDGIYEPMLERYFEDIDEFSRKKAQLIFNEILKDRKKFYNN